jgi:hypothetical protein
MQRYSEKSVRAPQASRGLVTFADPLPWLPLADFLGAGVESVVSSSATGVALADEDVPVPEVSACAAGGDGLEDDGETVVTVTGGASAFAAAATCGAEAVG